MITSENRYYYSIDDVIVAPDLFVHEVPNILLKAEWNGRIDEEQTDVSLRQFGRIEMREMSEFDHARVIGCARLYGLTTYDATCLALAIDTGLPLATLDRKLIAAARQANVALIE